MNLDLVVHHRYTDGNATDLSGYENHGQRIPSGGDYSVFDGQSSRIVTFPSASLDALGAVRARARLYVEELGDRRTIVEGYLAFAFGVEADGALAGSVLTASHWDGVTSPPGVVPLGRWVDVAFVYDGRDTALLSVDGRIVGSRILPLGPVAGVQWPYGLNVGAWPDGNLRVFKGQIGELWLWRRG